MTVPDAGPSATVSIPENRKRRWIASLLVGLTCFVIYNSNGRAISAGDTYPARYLPFSILKYHTLFLDPVASVAAQGRGDGAYWMLRLPDGHLMSLYPIALPLAVAPLYVPAVAYLHVRGWTGARLDHVARVMEKLSASLLAALSVSLLYVLMRRRTKARTALLLTFAYAFGTTTWVVSSQALWQHGLSQVLLIGILLLLTGSCTTPRAVTAAFLCGLVACNRPPDIVLAAVLGVYALSRVERRRWPLLAAAAAAPMLVVLVYNLSLAGNVAGGYGVIGGIHFFQHDLLEGIVGLTFSPTRGLFVFSPFLLFVFLLWKYLPHDREERMLILLMTAGGVLQVLLYAKSDWRSGLSWGPRYMTDLLPFLMWMLVPVVEKLRGAGRAIFHAAVVASVVIEAIGAFCYVALYDLPIYAADKDAKHNDMRAAFEWRNTPIVTSLEKGFVSPDLLLETRGAFDAIEAGGRRTSSINAGENSNAAGWALAGHATPAQVAVSIDGHQTFATTDFTPRPDVQQTLGESTRSGWTIPLDTSHLAPGEHHLTALVWPTKQGEARYLAERTLIVRGVPSSGSDLHDAFAKAAANIGEHQQPDGYWLTAHTSATRFVQAHPEMNTFLTALLVDLLDPLSAKAGLEKNVQRARRHLTSQIESTGLVRYHGLTTGPWIGTLGCAITPDTDDTALVWRIAPAPDRERLTTALSTIDQYRRPDGLYRSWLAPRDAYQCLDPGRDPNPSDVAIQMHLLLLLSKEQPSKGRALCEALRADIDEDRIWVYYSGTPVVPILRTTDLRAAGCDLTLPARRMRTAVAGQQTWVTVARLLARGSKEPAPDPAAVRDVLRELAKDDFASLRANPPLLYHNDLTATVSRYYWSEDAGYALWLKLFDKYEKQVQSAGGH